MVCFLLYLHMTLTYLLPLPLKLHRRQSLLFRRHLEQNNSKHPEESSMGYNTFNNTLSVAFSLRTCDCCLAALPYSSGAGLSRTDSSFANLLWGGGIEDCVGVVVRGPR